MRPLFFKATDMQRFIETMKYSGAEIAAKTGEIYEAMLSESSYLDAGNFTAIHPSDIERLFDLYAEQFFDGGLRRLLGEAPLGFRLSKRMTQAGGKTGRRTRVDGGGNVLHTEYEIAVSTTLLFQTFQDDHRPVVMSGIECRDRLAALQRVVEHEMIHLIEMLIWVNSSCSAPRFQSIANRFFGHTGHRHQLITAHERALTKFGIKTGDRVSFRFEGRHYQGIVNRITKRATVLIEDEFGESYSDGKSYKKFYIPLGMLKPVEA